jgi:site-specific recombinase XerD
MIPEIVGRDTVAGGRHRTALFRAPLSVAGYQRTVARAGVAAKFTFLVHSHMLWHACGFKLANDGHDTRAIQAYLGHRSIMSTVRYTALTPNRFKNFWKD